MEKDNTKVYNLIILDESGSMQSIKDYIISGFNELVQTVKGIAEQYPEQTHLTSFLTFNTFKITTHLDAELTSKLNEIDAQKYMPRAGTPLFDAMGQGINELRAKIGDEKNVNVLVTILTDGMENASREYDGSAIKALVEEMEEKNWTFTYIGTDHNVKDFATTISIKNTMVFSKSQAGLRRMFAVEERSRAAYSEKIRRKMSTKDNYYSNDEEGKS